MTLWQTKKMQSPSRKKRGPTLRPRGAPPGPHSGEGLGRPPQPTSARSPIRASRKRVAAKQNSRGKTKTKHKKHGNTLAASRPKKGPRKGASELKTRKFQENPKNARFPEWRPETPKNRTPKRAISQTRRDKKKDKTKTGARGGVLLLPDLSLLKKTKATSTKNLKRRERTQKQQT